MTLDRVFMFCTVLVCIFCLTFFFGGGGGGREGLFGFPSVFVSCGRDYYECLVDKC